ncbi:uncharacterized protein LOC108921988 [Scleropages formosus]|uniref:uncharacterized protein LOC108921988 n=1 Tax=Scleropages formosus TaxID=113540 RepID=UPI000878CA6A|nr:uncharacterized protein LOC108921988 [Scleropages formosus]
MFPDLCLHLCYLHNKTMLSRNLLMFSAMMFLATSVSAAPVEEKEVEEAEVEPEEGEEELSEEEDDDDSKSQDLNMGAGAQLSSTASKDQGTLGQLEASFEGDPFNGQKLNGAKPTDGGGHDRGTGGDPQAPPPDSSLHEPSLSAHAASSGHTSVAGASGGVPAHGSAAIQPGHPDQAVLPAQPEMFLNGDASTFSFSSQVDSPGSVKNGQEVPETESNGNGHKLLLGGSLSGATDQHGVDQSVSSAADGVTPRGLAGGSSHPDASGLAGDPGISQTLSTGAGDPSHVSYSTDHMGTGDRTAESSFQSVTTDAAVVSAMMSQTEHFSVDHMGNGHQKPGLETHHRGTSSAVLIPVYLLEQKN